ncbi:MAG TPA: hypothetical protein VF148_17210 [Acidimicrobiia bacterium]
MTSPAIEESLTRAERAVDDGEGLSGTGFWQAVSTVKGQPELADRYADRIAAIDERAHRDWAWLIIPLGVGTVLAGMATLVGLALVWWAYALDGGPAIVAFLIGFGVLLASTHALAHLVVGSIMGIRFSYWFVGEISRPQPGVKVDYASYLRTKAAKRAWMHASGAIVTKAIPFLLIGAAVAADLPAWVAWALAAFGVVTIATDALWSTKASDWKKFRREISFAQDS